MAKYQADRANASSSGSSSSGGGGNFIEAILFVIKWLITSGALLCIVIGAAISSTVGLVYTMITKMPYNLNIVAWVITTAIGFTLSFIAWQKEKKLLVILMIAIGVPGIIHTVATKDRIEVVEGEIAITATAIVTADSAELFPNLRASSKRIAVLSKGAEVSIVGTYKRSATWTQILYEDKKVWIETSRIQILEE